MFPAAVSSPELLGHVAGPHALAVSSASACSSSSSSSSSSSFSSFSSYSFSSCSSPEEESEEEEVEEELAEEVEEELEEDRRLPKGKQEEGAEGASWDKRETKWRVPGLRLALAFGEACGK